MIGFICLAYNYRRERKEWTIFWILCAVIINPFIYDILINNNIFSSDGVELFILLILLIVQFYQNIKKTLELKRQFPQFGFPYVEDIKEDRSDFAIKYKGKWGIYNKRDKKFELIFDAVNLNYHYKIAAKKKGKWGVIDWEGQIILPFEYEDIADDKDTSVANMPYKFFEERQTASYDYLFHYFVFYEDYKNVKSKKVCFLIGVKQNGLWGFIDNNCNEVYPFTLEKVECFTHNNNHVFTIRVKKISIGKKLELLFKDKSTTRYSLWYNLRDFIAEVFRKFEYEFFTVSQYQNIIIISNKKNEKTAGVFRSTPGQFVTKFEYDYVWPFNNIKYAQVGYRINNEEGKSERNKSGIIDINGNEILPCIYEFHELNYLLKDYFILKLDGKYGVMNNQCEIIFECIYDFIWMFVNDYYVTLRLEKSGKEFVVKMPIS